MQELTVDDVLRDPLIRLVMKADKVRPGDLAALLNGVARRSSATAAEHRIL